MTFVVNENTINKSSTSQVIRLLALFVLRLMDQIILYHFFPIKKKYWSDCAFHELARTEWLTAKPVNQGV